MMTYIHNVPGRLRVKSSAIGRAPQALRTLCRDLVAWPGVIDLSVNPLASSLTVIYDPGRLDPAAILDRAAALGLVPDARVRSVRPAAAGATTGDSTPGSTGPGSVAGPAASGAVAAVAATLGGAFGRALFGAVLKSGLERGVASLVTAAIR